MAVSVMPIPAWLSEATRSHSARSNHRAPFFHHAGISTPHVLRSDKLRPNGGKLLPPFQSLKNWKALDPTVMSWTTCCATTMNSYARFQGVAQRRPVRRVIFNVSKISHKAPAILANRKGLPNRFGVDFTLLGKKMHVISHSLSSFNFHLLSRVHPRRQVIEPYLHLHSQCASLHRIVPAAKQRIVDALRPFLRELAVAPLLQCVE